MRNNKKGMTIIEIILSFVLITIVVVGLFNIVLDFKNERLILSTNTDITRYRTIVTNYINNELLNSTYTANPVVKNNDTFEVIINGSGDCPSGYSDIGNNLCRKYSGLPSWTEWSTTPVTVYATSPYTCNSQEYAIENGLASYCLARICNESICTDVNLEFPCYSKATYTRSYGCPSGTIKVSNQCYYQLEKSSSGNKKIIVEKTKISYGSFEDDTFTLLKEFPLPKDVEVIDVMVNNYGENNLFSSIKIIITNTNSEEDSSFIIIYMANYLH